MMNKFPKSDEQKAEQIRFRFKKQAGESFNKLDSYKVLSLIESFSPEIREEIAQKIIVDKNELPVILMYFNHQRFMLVSTEKIYIKKPFSRIFNCRLEEIKNGFWDFHEEIFERKISGELNQRQTENTIKMKQEGFTLKFRLELKNNKKIIFKFPTGSSAYSFINTLNVLELVGRKYN